MRTLLALLLSALSALSASAAVYYVDPSTGNDSNNGTSINTPFQHPPGSVGFSGSGWPPSIVNGDKVIIKGGSANNVSLLINNTQTHYNGNSSFDSIIIQSGHLFTPQWGTGRAIFDGQNIRFYGIGLDGQHVCNGVTLDGFEIRNIAAGSTPDVNGNGSACIEVSAATFFTVKHCWMHDALRNVQDQGFGIESGAVANNFIVIQNEVGPAIGTKGIEMFNTSIGVLSNNWIHGGNDHGLVIGSHSTNVDICNNMIYRAENTISQPSYSLELVSCDHCDVWNNLIFGPTPQTPLGSEGIGQYEYDISNRFVFNTVALLGDSGNDGSSTAIRTGDFAMTNMASLFQNNIFYKNFNNDGNIQYCIPYPQNVGFENVQFNVFWGGVSGTENVAAYRIQGNPSDTISPLSTYNPTTTSHTYANNQQKDPGLNGGTLPNGLDANYHPNTTYFMLSQTNVTTSAWIKTSNVINGNAASGYDHSSGKFSVDILGFPRSLWSMGAYEFESFLPIITNVTLIMK